MGSGTHWTPASRSSRRLKKAQLRECGALGRTLNVARSRSPGLSGLLASPLAQLAKRSTPRVRPSGAASPLDLFEPPAPLRLEEAQLRECGALGRTLNVARSRSPGLSGLLASPLAQLAKRSTPRVRPSGAASPLGLFEPPAPLRLEQAQRRECGALGRPLSVARSRSLGLSGLLASPLAQLAKRSTPRVRPSGAASPLGLFEPPAPRRLEQAQRRECGALGRTLSVARSRSPGCQECSPRLWLSSPN